MRCISKTNWVDGWKFCTNCHSTWPQSYGEENPPCSYSQQEIRPEEINLPEQKELETNLAVEEQMANDKLSHWKDTK